MSVRRTLRFCAWAAAVLGATLAGVTAASALTGGGGASGERRAAVDQLIPREGTTRVAPGAADPAGGPRWVVRAYESEEGLSCVEAGRATPDGRYGRLDPDGRVTELPSGPHGTCGDLAIDPVVLAVDSRAGRFGMPDRTVLYGLAGPDVASVSAGSPGRGMEPLELSRDRTFLLVVDGLHPPHGFPIDVRLRDGRVQPYRW